MIESGQIQASEDETFDPVPEITKVLSKKCKSWHVNFCGFSCALCCTLQDCVQQRQCSLMDSHASDDVVSTAEAFRRGHARCTPICDGSRYQEI